VSLLAPGTGPLSQPAVLVLPVASLALYGGAYTARMVRGVVAEIATTPHVEAARIAGLPEHLVLRRHVLPPAAGAIAQVLALLVPYLVGGALVVETVFAYPGLGALLASAVRARDAVQVEAAGLVLAAVAIAGFLAAELVHGRSGRVTALPVGSGR
jgi:peptide/nickel transport system permease protein